MGRLGDLYREARLAKGVSLAEVEQATHIRERVLAGLEDGDYSRLPPPVFLRGLARTYASYLELDQAEVSALLDEEIGALDHPEVRPAVEDLHTPGVITGPMVGTILSLVVVLALGWYLSSRIGALASSLASGTSALAAQTPVPTHVRARETPLPSPTIIEVAETVSTPTPTPSATAVPTRAASPTATSTPSPSPTPEFGVIIQAHFTKRCWVEVKVDGEVATSETIPAGETRIWRGRNSVSMHAGVPDGVEITFNGKYQGLLGTSGGTVKVEWTRP